MKIAKNGCLAVFFLSKVTEIRFLVPKNVRTAGGVAFRTNFSDPTHDLQFTGIIAIAKFKPLKIRMFHSLEFQTSIISGFLIFFAVSVILFGHFVLLTRRICSEIIQIRSQNRKAANIQCTSEIVLQESRA